MDVIRSTSGDNLDPVENSLIALRVENVGHVAYLICISCDFISISHCTKPLSTILYNKTLV